MNETFQACVDLLVIMAECIGMTYEEINIWIFLIGYPLILGISILSNYILVRKYVKLNK